jgi:hypothetical protein
MTAERPRTSPGAASASRIALLIGGLAIGVHPAQAQRAPLALPLHDPAYALLDGLDYSGCAPARVSPYRPYDIPRVRAAIRLAQADRSCAPALVSILAARFDVTDDSVPVQPAAEARTPGATASRTTAAFNLGAELTRRVTSIGREEFRPFAEDLRPKSEGDPPAVGMLRVRGRYAATPRTVAVMEAYGQSHARNDPLVRSRRLRSTTGVVGITEATFAGAAGPLTFSIGRDREVWLGRETESLVLSGNAPPLDRLMASLSTKHFEARALYAALDDVVLDTLTGELPSGTPPQRFYRSLAAHALTWRPSRAFEITAGETVLLSRGSRTIELGYANPLMPYVFTQNDAAIGGNQVRDNLGVFVAGRTRAGRSMFTAELLIDDLQIDADREITPNQLAWRIEGRQGWAAPMPGSLGLEYERVDGYTYLRGLYTDVYEFSDRPLGSELGPDADRARGFVELWPSGTLRVASSVGVWRRGAQRLGRRPAEGAVGNAGQTFPTTTVERPVTQRALLADVTVAMIRWDFPVYLRVEGARIRNPSHVAGGNALHVRAHLTGSYAFRYP